MFKELTWNWIYLWLDIWFSKDKVVIFARNFSRSDITMFILLCNFVESEETVEETVEARGQIIIEMVMNK